MLQQIVAATDGSEVGRHAVRVAIELSNRSNAHLTVMTTMSAPRLLHPHSGPAAASPRPPGATSPKELWRRIGADLDVLAAGDAECAVAYGIPGIEIVRFAEERQADLLVLGRKRRSQAERLLLGDTADAVARRSSVSCLFVPLEQERFRHVLAALDGSERGLGVFKAACDFAQATQTRLRLVTVERRHPSEVARPASLLAGDRSVKLGQAIDRMIFQSDYPMICESEHGGARGGHAKAFETMPALVVRRGDPVVEVLAETTEQATDVLVVGYHRWGPPGVIDVGNVARRLVHGAPVAVLTVPL